MCGVLWTFFEIDIQILQHLTEKITGFVQSIDCRITPNLTFAESAAVSVTFTNLVAKMQHFELHWIAYL